MKPISTQSDAGPSQLFLWVLLILGVPVRYWQALNDGDVGAALRYQAAALVASTCAFGAITYMWATELLALPFLHASWMSLVASCGSFMIDRMTLIDIRSGHGRAASTWLLRLGIWAMALMAMILVAVKNHAGDLNRLQAAQVDALLEKDPSAVAAKGALNLAQKNAERRAALLQEITDTTKAKETARAEHRQQIEGAYDPLTGRDRPEGDGKMAKHFNAEAIAAEKKLAGLNAEATALGNVKEASQDAAKALKDIRSAIEKQQLGASKRIQTLVDLLRTEPTAWISIVFGSIFGLLAELLLLRAMGKFPQMEAAFRHISGLEDRLLRARIFQTGRELKASIAAPHQSFAVSRARSTPSAGKRGASAAATGG